MKRSPFLTGALLLALPALGCGAKHVIAQSDDASSDLPTTGGPDAAVTDGSDGSATPGTAGTGGSIVSADGMGGVNSIGGSASGGIAGAAGMSGGGGTAGAAGGAGPGAAGAPPPAPVSFLAARNTAAGVGPASIALGDLNHDGKLDLAIADRAGGVSILLGRGDSTFPSPVNYDAGSKPTSVALGDLNGDGSLDLAVGNGGGGVSVLLNNGDGTFPGPVDYAVGSKVVAVAIGDLNGDGKLDLAIANAAGSVSGGMNVLMNKGDGTFAAPASYRPGNYSVQLAIGDVNDDGDPDLVVADASGGVVVLLNNGNGTFVTQAAFETDSVATSVVAADFNGDGRTDIAYTSGSLNILINTGNSTFDLKDTYTYGDASFGPDEAVALGDLNGDQIPDLVVVNAQSGIASVFLNQVGGRFVRHDYSAGSAPKFVALGDLNGDGRAELVVSGDALSDFVTVLSSTGNGSFLSDVGYRSGPSSTSIAIADVDRDGNPDLVTASYNTLNVILNHGKSGLATVPLSYPVASPVYVAVGDLDGDGSLDLAAAGYLSLEGENSVGHATILLNKGAGAGMYGPPVNYTAGTYAFDIKIGDLNGDGKLDLVVADQNQGTQGSQAAVEVTVFLNAGGGTFAAGVPYPVVATGTTNLDLSIGLGDLNGDGRPDLVEALGDASVAGFGKVTILLNDGSGAFVESASGPTGIDASRILVADLNGDGRADLAVSEYTKTVAVLLNRGAGIFASPVRYSILGDGFNIAAGDLNGDGKIDLAVSGYEGNIGVLLNNGAGVFVPGGNYASRGGPASLTLGDLNGDGRAEIATTINGGSDSTVRVLWNTTP